MNRDIDVVDCRVRYQMEGHGIESFNCASPQQAVYLACMMRRLRDASFEAGASARPRWKYGWLFNKHSWWMGLHYSEHNKRWCLNLIPCFTLWLTRPGGKTP